MAITTVLTTVALALPIIFFVWQITSQTVVSRLPTLQNKRICLLIAHPDDEAMFFAPTLLALTKPELGNHVKVLCLSSGDADGLGEVRKKELLSSITKLGLRSASDAFLLDDPSRFPDGITKTWPANSIADVLSSAFCPPLPQSQPTQPPTTHTSSRKKSSKSSTPSAAPPTTAPAGSAGQEDGPPRCTIDVLITFDEQGISNHPNHKSLFDGAHAFLSRIMKGKAGYACPLDLYTLRTISILRKYLSVLDAPMSMLLGALHGSGLNEKAAQLKGGSSGKGKGAGAGRLIFVSGVTDYWKAVGAMTQAHKSQMVWFRWGWVGIGRYMVVNDLKREKVKM